jgi:hypothetical protein
LGVFDFSSTGPVLPPPLPEHEQPLAAVLWRVEDLARLKMDVWQLAVEVLYLLGRERFEDIHQREEPYPLFRSKHDLPYPFT